MPLIYFSYKLLASIDHKVTITSDVTYLNYTFFVATVAGIHIVDFITT